jgi:hypothetical protein
MWHFSTGYPLEFGFGEGITSHVPKWRISSRSSRAGRVILESLPRSLSVGSYAKLPRTRRVPVRSRPPCRPVPTRPHSPVKAAAPFPLVEVDRAACAPRDRADMYVVIDVPAVRAFGIAAAAEGEHDP